MRGARRLIVGLVGAALALAPAAGAADPPSAYADARRGSFIVVSGVLVFPEGAELKGVWLDETQPCTRTRTLDVRIEVSYTPSTGTGATVRRSRSGRVGNCAEGGPNFGFDVRATSFGLACQSGAWKPGRYAFLTRTRDRSSGLQASASLLWHKTGAC